MLTFNQRKYLLVLVTQDHLVLPANSQRILLHVCSKTGIVALSLSFPSPLILSLPPSFPPSSALQIGVPLILSLPPSLLPSLPPSLPPSFPPSSALQIGVHVLLLYPYRQCVHIKRYGNKFIHKICVYRVQ